MTPRVRRTASAVALLMAAALAGCATASPAPAGAAAPKNIIVLIADGAAAMPFELARLANRELRNEGLATTDSGAGSVGVMTTPARDALSTDTAAAATAMSTGVKIRTGMIATTPEGERLATALQAAQLAGKRIGLVTTARVSDALPAAFSVLDHENSHAIHHQEPFEPQFASATPGALGRMVARQTGFFWASQAHGAAPVVVGALGPGAGLFRGWYDNADFGRALQRLIRGPGRPAP